MAPCTCRAALAAEYAASPAATFAAETSRAAWVEPARSERAGEVEGDADVGHGVLERLVLPDEPAELLALLGVADRLVEEPLPGAEQLGGAGQGGSVER